MTKDTKLRGRVARRATTAEAGKRGQVVFARCEVPGEITARRGVQLQCRVGIERPGLNVPLYGCAVCAPMLAHDVAWSRRAKRDMNRESGLIASDKKIAAVACDRP